MSATAYFQTGEDGLFGLLNWHWPIADGIIKCKDESYLAGYFYRGPDLSSASREIHASLAERINRALASLTGGWAFWVEAVRLGTTGYPAPELMHFRDPISRLIDEERRDLFLQPDRHFETQYLIILQWMPPSSQKSYVSGLVYSDDSDLGTAEHETLEEFRQSLRLFESQIRGAVDLAPMGDFMVDGDLRSQMVNYLEYTVTGKPASLNLPPPGNGLDIVLAQHEFYPGFNPLVGGRYVSVIRVSGFPKMSHPGILSILDSLPFPVRFSSRYIVLEQNKAQAAIKAISRKWAQKILGPFSQALKLHNPHPDEDAAEMAQEAGEALKRTRSSLEATGYYTPVLVLMDEDLAVLKARTSVICQAISRAGFQAVAETINAPEAWIGSLPGHLLHNVRRPPLHTGNLVHLVPLTSRWKGSDEAPCPLYPPHQPPLMVVDGDGASPLSLNLHVGDLGHTLLFGPPGSGKSTLLATVALQAFRYEGMTVWCFEKGRSMLIACEAAEGRHYDFGDDAEPRFCPMADLSTEGDILAAEEWIATCFLLQHGRIPETSERADIHDAIKLMAVPGSGRTVSDFLRMAQNDRVRDAMRYYSLSGTAGRMFDAEADALDEGRFNVFEIEDLMRRGEAILLPALFSMFRRFEKSLRGQPAFLLLDEAWIMFGHPYFREKIREWLKVLRKLNCSVILATQSLSDAARSGILDVLLEATATKIFGANPEALVSTGSVQAPGPREYYEMLGMSRTQIELIRNLEPKRHYYLTSEDGQTVFDLCLGPKAMAFVGSASKDAIRRVRQLKAAHGEQWPYRWLEEKGTQ